MSSEQKSGKFYLTTPIYYVNARPHIGHAYTTLAADTIARRQRLLLGKDNVYFLTGTDEHGQKVQRSAEAAGVTPQEFTDQVSETFRSLWKRMGITYDDYIRTTDPRHKRGVQALFNKLYENGHIELNSYTGSYCVSDEAFVDLPAGTPCPDCGRPLETVTEENFFFKLSNYQLQLIDLIESGEFAVEPEARRNEVLSFLRGNVSAATSSKGVIPREAEGPAVTGASVAYSAAGNAYVPGALKDLSISRSSFDWGIPVPEPAASQTKKKHVIYVWLDALANYMTALGYGQQDCANFDKFWPADLHLVGKEIIRFHCVYWPAFLLAAGIPLPKKVQAHGWLLFEESKMSKSRGNIVRSETILDAFGSLKPEASKEEQDLFGTDVLRYFLLREIPFGNDGSFSFDALVQRYNADLANGYGNLVSRTLNLVYQKFGGIFQDPIDESRLNAAKNSDTPSGSSTEPAHVLADVYALTGIISRSIDALNFHLALSVFQDGVALVDQMLTAQAPWKANMEADSDRLRVRDCLQAAAECIRLLTSTVSPLLPVGTAKVWAQLGLGDINEAAKNGELTNLTWGGLKPGTPLGTLGPIFPRAPKELIQQMTDAEIKPTTTPAATEAPASTPAPAAETAPTNEPTIQPTNYITIDDFAKVELRVAKVLSVERIPKADKLLKIQVDLGYEQRQILSGIAEFYEPESLIGRRIVVITNLAPRKMRGLESNGMLLAASEGDHGHPYLATFLEEVPLGSRLK